MGFNSGFKGLNVSDSYVTNMVKAEMYVLKRNVSFIALTVFLTNVS